MAIAIAQDSFVVNSTANGTSSYTSSSFTVGSGANKVLVAHVYGCSESASSGHGVSSISFGGNAMTQITESGINSRVWCGAYRLIGPSAGAGTVSITTNGNQRALLVHLIEYTDVDQTTPVSQSASGGSGTKSVHTASKTTSDDGAWLVAGFCLRGGNGPFTAGGGGTEIAEDSTGSSGATNVDAVTGYEEQPTAGLTEFTLTSTSSARWSALEYELKPASGGDTTVNATTDALTLTEQAATITYDVNVSAGTDALSLTEYAATVSLGVDVQANTDALTLTEYAASITYDVDVQAGTDTLTLTENAATISYDIDVQATTDALTLIEYAATITTGSDVLVSANTDALTLTEQQATITYDVEVLASTDVLNLTEYAATITNPADVEEATQQPGGFLPKIYLDRDGNETTLEDLTEEAVAEVTETKPITRQVTVRSVSKRVLGALGKGNAPKPADIRKLRRALAEKETALAALNDAIKAQREQQLIDDEITALLLAA